MCDYGPPVSLTSVVAVMSSQPKALIFQSRYETLIVLEPVDGLEGEALVEKGVIHTFRGSQQCVYMKNVKKN